MIREYNPDIPNEEDVRHITSYGEQIIPGPSWGGAIRSAIYNIKRTLRVKSHNPETVEEKIKNIINGLFGYVETKEDVAESFEGETHEDLINHSKGKGFTPRSSKDAQASRIIIDESIIRGNKLLPYTRNRISRFSGEVIEGALFSELLSNQGEVNLTIRIKNFKQYEVGLVLLALLELYYGFQSIGGTTSIGRGILKGKSINLNGETISIDDIKKSKYLTALGKEIENRIN